MWKCTKGSEGVSLDEIVWDAKYGTATCCLTAETTRNEDWVLDTSDMGDTMNRGSTRQDKVSVFCVTRIVTVIVT